METTKDEIACSRRRYSPWTNDCHIPPWCAAHQPKIWTSGYAAYLSWTRMGISSAPLHFRYQDITVDTAISDILLGAAILYLYPFVWRRVVRNGEKLCKNTLCKYIYYNIVWQYVITTHKRIMYYFGIRIEAPAGAPRRATR